jgi:hypothetical protein
LEAAAALEVKLAEASALVGATVDATGCVAGEVTHSECFRVFLAMATYRQIPVMLRYGSHGLLMANIAAVSARLKPPIALQQPCKVGSSQCVWEGV